MSFCPVCKNKLTQFDDLIYQCKSEDTHRYTLVMDYESSLHNIVKIEFEHIRIPYKEGIFFALEISHKDNYSQIVKIYAYYNAEGKQTGTNELQIPFYRQDGIIELNFNNIPETIEKLEQLETFS